MGLRLAIIRGVRVGRPPIRQHDNHIKELLAHGWSMNAIAGRLRISRRVVRRAYLEATAKQ